MYVCMYVCMYVVRMYVSSSPLLSCVYMMVGGVNLMGIFYCVCIGIATMECRS